jgi:small-conductance mechanosensitive channel
MTIFDHPWEVTASWFTGKGLDVAFLIVGGAIAYIVGGKILSAVIQRVVYRKLRKASPTEVKKRQQTLVNLGAVLWRILVVVTITVSVLRIFFPALDLTPLFASAGVVGIAIAFGSQALVKDFLTGLFIIVENQYRVGDYVNINDADGRVEHIGVRSTIIRDASGNAHYLPNGTIGHVVNRTMGYSKVHFTLLLEASTDIDATVAVINEVGEKLASADTWRNKILSPPQFNSLGAITGSSIEVIIEGKTNPSEQWKVTAEMRRRLLKAFEKKGIKLA